MQWKKKLVTIITGMAMVIPMLFPAVAKADAIPVTITTENNEVIGFGEKETKDIVLVVKNNTDTDLTNIIVTPTLKANADGWPFEISQQDYAQKIDSLAAGTSANLTFHFTAREDVAKEYYKLKFKIGYDTAAQELEQIIYVKTTPKKADPTPAPTPTPTPVPESTGTGAETGDGGVSALSGGEVANGEVYSSGGGSTDASVPRVIVTGFSTEPAAVKAGTNFKLIIHVKNTSKTSTVSNMLFDVQAPSSGTEAATEAPAFLPISGSSSIYLDQIGCEQTKDISIDMNARADLVQKPYSINLSMKYEDGNKAQYESMSSLAVPVEQPPRFEFSKLEFSPESIAVGEDTNLSCSLYNTGRIKLYNVKVKITGTAIEETETFVGNIDSGGTGAIDVMVTGKKETKGTEKCKMVVSYEDEAGKASTTEEEFALEVTPLVAEDEAVVTEETTESGFPLVPIVIGVLVLVIAGVVTFIVLHRKKKLSNEEEDLLNELDGPSEDE